MRNLTASAMPRTMACDSSMVLPRVNRTETGYTTRGRAGHRFLLVDLPKLGREAALKLVPEEHFDWCEAIDPKLLPLDTASWAHEVAFALDPYTGMAMELGRGEERAEAYKNPMPWWVLGQADVIGLTDDEVIVLDLKTGFHPLGKPDEHGQLLTYAVMAAKAYNRKRARVGFIFVRPDNERPGWVTFDLDEGALSRWHEKLRRRQRQKDAFENGHAIATPTEGEHCRHCPSFAYCPAKARLASYVAGEALPEGLAEVHAQGGITLTPEAAGVALARLGMYRSLLDEVEKKVKEYVREQPHKAVPLPDGKRWWGERKQTRFSIDDTEKAQARVTELYGADVAAAATLPEYMTGTSLEKALRLWVARTPGAKITKVEESARAELVKAEAAKETPENVFRAWTPKAEELEKLRAPAALEQPTVQEETKPDVETKEG